jgi:DNA invertase Pin-like site-specific DNA recombinase
MPPIRTKSSQNSTEQEGRVLLAIEAYKNKEITSLHEVTRRFDIPRTTLRRRLASSTNRAETRANSHKLT